MCWLAGAVRTLQKRVELPEAATNGTKCKDDDLHDFEQKRVGLPEAATNGTKCKDDDLHDLKQKRVELPEAATNGTKCKDDDLHDFEQILCDDLCVPRQRTVHEMDFFDVMAYNQVETVPLCHVSFAETAEMVEFDPTVHTISALMIETVPMVEYGAPAPTAAQQVEAVEETIEIPQLQTIEKIVDTPAHQVHAALIPVVEYDTPQSTVTHQVHAVPAPVDEYDAPVACATPSPSMDGLVVKVVNDSQLQVVEKTIEIPQLQAIKEIVDIPEIQTGQCIENLDYAPDLKMTLADRTFRIPRADSEEAIEELSRAMAEGFSAMIYDIIENFDKPDGLCCGR